MTGEQKNTIYVEDSILDEQFQSQNLTNESCINKINDTNNCTLNSSISEELSQITDGITPVGIQPYPKCDGTMEENINQMTNQIINLKKKEREFVFSMSYAKMQNDSIIQNIAKVSLIIIRISIKNTP
jgi:hypothetical protein